MSRNRESLPIKEEKKKRKRGDWTTPGATILPSRIASGKRAPNDSSTSYTIVESLNNLPGPRFVGVFRRSDFQEVVSRLRKSETLGPGSRRTFLLSSPLLVGLLASSVFRELKPKLSVQRIQRKDTESRGNRLPR